MYVPVFLYVFLYVCLPVTASVSFDGSSQIYVVSTICA